jgi:hypothetical protein
VWLAGGLAQIRTAKYSATPLWLQDDTGHLGVETARGFYHQMVLFGTLKQGRQAMRSTINLDDKLMERARSLTGTAGVSLHTPVNAPN